MRITWAPCFESPAQEGLLSCITLPEATAPSRFGGLVQSTAGGLYGTTCAGGSYADGTVFRLSVGLGPFVKMLPPSGKIGTTARILETDLTGATKVSFSGMSATFS